MAFSFMSVPPEQMQQYIHTAQARKHQRIAAIEQRRRQGIAVAQTAAQMLKTEFAVSRIVVFGSLLSGNFHETSDIDLAVWGLPEKAYFQAVARLLSLSDFEVDLVEAQYASPEILAAIVHGIEL